MSSYDDFCNELENEVYQPNINSSEFLSDFDIDMDDFIDYGCYELIISD